MTRRIIVVALGTGGDVFPLIGLGVALRRVGHEVTVVTHAVFRDAVLEAALEVVTVDDAERYVQRITDPELFRAGRGSFLMLQLFASLTEPVCDALASLAGGADAQLVASGGAYGARLFSAWRGARLLNVALSPWALPREVPEGAAARVDQILAPVLGPAAERRGVTLPSRGLGAWGYSPDGVLALYPSWFEPLPTSAPRPMTQTHFVHYEPSRLTWGAPTADATAPSALPVIPAILATMGSLPVPIDPWLHALEAATRTLGEHALVLSSVAARDPRWRTHESIRAVAYAPFSQVLPGARVLVHPGGIGTIARALRAGIPQVIVPLTNDQPYNALRVEKLGAGCLLPKGELSAESLVAAVRHATSVDVTARCRELAQRVADESGDGLARSCAVIERGAP